MRMLELHVVPLWQEEDGTRTLGLLERPDHPPVVGWCATALIIIQGRSRWFLLMTDANE